MKPKIRKAAIGMIVMIVMISVISACRPSEPTIDIEAQRTGFAQTADVQATMTFEAQPTATETPDPTPTFTASPEPTSTPLKTATATNGAVQPPGGGADAGRWIGQDVPDNTQFSPGEAFTVTWSLENTGTSTWTTSYYIEFFSGDQMDAVDKVFLPVPVSPERNVQISVEFTAPQSTGTYRSNWKLVNANDQSFADFYIIIEVVESN